MKNHKNNAPVMDERQWELTGRALIYAGIFLAVCMVIAVICDLILTGEPGWELFALVCSSLVFLIANKKLGDIRPPKSWCGKPLPTGDSAEDRATRRNSYLINSLLLGTTFATMDMVLLTMGKEDLTDLEMVKTLLPNGSYGLLVAVTALLSFVIIFVVSLVIEYLYHEKYELNAYRKMLSDLDEDEI